MTDVVGTPQKILGTKFEASTDGSVWHVINKCTTKKLPLPVASVDDTTGIDSACVSESNTVVDYGNIELDIIYDRADSGHALLRDNVGNPVDLYWKITHPDTKVTTFRANSKEFGDKQGGPKNNQMATFKGHCNTVPSTT